MFDYNSYYDNISRIFNNIRLDKQEEISTTTSIVRNYVDHNSRILDVGCGTGRYAYDLKRNGYKVVGIDKSDSQIAQAKKIISAIQGNAINMPFENNIFDLCILVMVVQQLTKEELDLTLNEIKRVLKRNGFLIIKTCSSDDLKKRFSNKYFPSSLKINMQRYPSISDLENKLLILGYDVVKKIPTKVVMPIRSDDWIFSIENKHNSTLALLEEDEFQRGLELIKKDFPNIVRLEKAHYHTYIIAKS